MPTIRHILVGIDFSEYSREAARYATYLAAKLTAKVYFLHVQDPPKYPSSGFSSYEPHTVKRHLEQEKNREQESLAELKKFIAEFEKSDTMTRHLVAFGNVTREILRVAEDKDIDLIVIGTHGKTGLSNLLPGSVAEKVVRKAACPVLAVKLSSQNTIAPSF